LLVELAGLYEKRQQFEPAIHILKRALSEEPSLEEAHAGMMRLYALSGRMAEAIRQYERLEGLLTKELGAEPGVAVRRLRDNIATGDLGPTRTPGPHHRDHLGADKHNLPASRTSFVGRERELVEVKRDLAMTRLLTLTGVGGSGKTRLALEAACDLVPIYPDGVWLTELARLSESRFVPRAVAEALDVPERPGQPLIDTLIDALRGKELLLILDNCEHLIDAAADLADSLLVACPRLRILATSRESLNVVGEADRPVLPLGVPTPQRESTVAEVEGSESARLLLERARHRNPYFAITPDNAWAVAEVCQRLDGIPLAIELAAAMMKTLSVEQIVERLRDSLELLKGSGRTLPPRHWTLRKTLDWSHDLLRQQEQALFRRLSVFAGGWTLDAAQVVGTGGDVEEAVLELLSGLVDKSLVLARANREGATRYWMLETVRHYAVKKLAESEEAGSIQRRHAEYFLALVEEEPEAFKGLRRPEWTRRVEEEHDNLRTALSWSLESGEAELALRLAGATQPFWAQRGHYDEGRRWLEAAIATGGQAPVPVWTNALRGVGWLALWQGDIDRASAAAEEGLQLAFEAERGNSLRAHLLLLLGFAATLRADYGRAVGLLEESLRLGREAEDGWSIAASLLQLGNVAGDQGDHSRAVALYEEGLALCRESGYAVVMADTLTNLGYTLLLRGDYDRAAALNEEAAALYREQGYTKARLEFPLDNLGWAALMRGDTEKAQALHRESLTLCHELGNKLIAAESIDGLACAAGAMGQAERSAQMFAAADALRRAQDFAQLPEERALREPHLTAARTQQNEAAWAAGSKLTFEEAIEYALSENQAASPVSLAPHVPSAADQPLTVLTRRQEEVAALVASGLTNGRIAARLSVSEHTVATHVARILKKLGLQSRAQVGSWLAERRPTSEAD
jgi:predicted ATPase/DNA-binding CsgD family transcriptional regulator/Tfp pilus assembly protein PilF